MADYVSQAQLLMVVPFTYVEGCGARVMGLELDERNVEIWRYPKPQTL